MGEWCGGFAGGDVGAGRQVDVFGYVVFGGGGEGEGAVVDVVDEYGGDGD